MFMTENRIFLAYFRKIAGESCNRSDKEALKLPFVSGGRC
jgi:hypothetical protein